MPHLRPHSLAKPILKHRNKQAPEEVGNSHGKADPRRWEPYDYRWRQARLRFLRRHPLCEHCKYEEKLTEATEVDHIIPHRGDMKRFWDMTNWMALCKPCHSKKTYEENRNAKQT